MEKMNIQVRERNQVILSDGRILNGHNIIKTIQRKPWMESCGNFNPIFCRYQGKRYLVKSDEGDLSDPFRADESYLQTLYIEVE